MRVRRIRGQVEALERKIEAEAGCAKDLHLTVACRGAMNALMAELVEGHVRHHVIPPGGKADAAQSEAAEDVIRIVRTYLR